MRYKTSTTRSVSAPSKVDETDLFLHLDNLYDDLAKVFTPIGNRPPRYGTLANYNYIAEKELADFHERRKRVNCILKQEFDPIGIARRDVWEILGRWWSPFDSGTIEQYATAMVDGRDTLRRDIKRVTTVQRVVVKIGPLPAPIRERFLTDRDRFLETLKSVIEHLNRDLSRYQQAIQILKRAGAQTLRRRPRRTLPTTPTAVQALHQLLSRKVPEQSRRAPLVQSLLRAWNPEKAPVSPESVRTGYR